jgi:organic hydroperoxide reductase OsmC/OhrA
METKPALFYHTEVVWTGEREGVLRSWPLPAIQVAAPPEFKGREGVWTPEHLYVAAVNSCFMTTFLAIAENSKLTIRSFDCTARGKLETVEGSGYQITEIKLYPRLEVPSARDADRAGRIIEKSKRNCLISNSIKTEVVVEPSIISTEEDLRRTLDSLERDLVESPSVNGGGG